MAPFARIDGAFLRFIRGFLRFVRGFLRQRRLNPSRLDAGVENNLLDLLLAQIETLKNAGMLLRLPVSAFLPAGQFIRGAIGEIFDIFDPVFAERNQHCRREAFNLGKFVLYAKRPALFGQFGFLTLQKFAGAFLDFLRRVLVEALDACDFLRVRHRQAPRRR